jgi:PAS domain S-box-containing protein
VTAVQSASSAQTIDRDLAGWARVLFDGIDDALFVHDLAGNILEANPAACQRLGYTRDEMLKLTTRDIDDPTFAAGFEERLHEQLHRGQFRCEGRHRTKDGRVIAVDINTSAIQFHGQPAVLAVMRDITRRKAMEDALRSQTALLQSILDNMGEAVIVAGETGGFLVCNPAAQRLFGLAEGAGNLPPQGPEFCQYLPDRVTPCPPEQLPLARAGRGDTFDDVEIFLRHARAPQGRWLSIAGRPLRDAVGNTCGGIIVCRDISGRKRAEARRNTQYAVTRALDECADLERAGPLILRYIGEGLGWDIGALWLLDPSAGVLRCQCIWSHPDVQAAEFVEFTRTTTFARGRGLPGRVWSTQHSVFVPDVTRERNFPRAAQAAHAGLKSGFAFPIRSGGDTVGVVESFHRRMEQPDAELLAMMATMGSQIGQVLERQRVENALRESEAFYHSLVESLPQNIFRKDRDGRVTFGNQRYVATLKSTLPDLLGKTDFDLFPDHLARKYRDDDRRVMETGKVFEAVEEHRLPDGTKIYVQVIKTPIFNNTGEVIGTQGVFWDVTEKKRSEEAIAESERRYRQLTEATQDAIVVADQDGRITLFNPAAERLFGYPAREVLGQNVDLLMPDEYRARHAQGLRRYLATRQSRIVGRPIEMHGRRKDGTTFPLELALSAIDVGDQMRFLGAIRDLTERNRIRAMLVQNEKLASIGLLSAGVAHEINNPLAFVANNLAVLDRDSKGLMEVLALHEALIPKLAQVAPEDAARAAELAEEIDLPYIRENLGRLLARTRDGVDRVTRIVQSLRGLARTDSPRRQETHLPDLFDNSLEIIRGRLKRQHVELETCYDPNSKLFCVQTQLSQVFLNLLVNAQQAIETAARPEGGKITVRTKRLADEMLIEVSDTGCGIDPAHLPKLFDPFFTTKDVGEGTGLGLSIAHNIVRGHGGRIEVDSIPGKGTTFRVYLPLQPS